MAETIINPGDQSDGADGGSPRKAGEAMTRSAPAMRVAEGHSTPYQEGYRAGLTGDYAPNPWDGRTKAGREWREGYRAGRDAEWAMKQPDPIRGRVEAASRVINDARKGNDA